MRAIGASAITFFARRRSLVEKFYREFAPQVVPFILYGSGDFHYLSALWLRRLNEPVVLVSFDESIRIGTFARRNGAVAAGSIARLSTRTSSTSPFGAAEISSAGGRCNIFANRRAERAGRLEVHPWADHRPVERSTTSRCGLAARIGEIISKLFVCPSPRNRNRLCHDRSRLSSGR